MMCLYLGGTPLAHARTCLRAFGKDERLAIFTVPLLREHDVHHRPASVRLRHPRDARRWALAVHWFHRLDRDWKANRTSRSLVGVVAVAMFYAHVVRVRPLRRRLRARCFRGRDAARSGSRAGESRRAVAARGLVVGQGLGAGAGIFRRAEQGRSRAVPRQTSATSRSGRATSFATTATKSGGSFSRSRSSSRSASAGRARESRRARVRLHRRAVVCVGALFPHR